MKIRESQSLRLFICRRHSQLLKQGCRWLCSNVRQPCLIMGKAAPALRHWRKSLHTCVKPCDSCRKYVVICVNDATFATPVARLAQLCPGWSKHDADHYIAASALPWLATSLANDAGRWIASLLIQDNNFLQIPSKESIHSLSALEIAEQMTYLDQSIFFNIMSRYIPCMKFVWLFTSCESICSELSPNQRRLF